MISGYACDGGRLKLVDVATEPLRTIWVDLVEPTEEEEALVEASLRINVPTREDMEEIEVSSRLYYQDGAAYMTANLPARAETDSPHMAPVTFVLAGDRLITVRYHEPRAFQTFPRRAERVPMGCVNGEAVLVALLEAVVDRLADVLERAGGEIENISRTVFRNQKAPGSRNFQKILEEIGAKGGLTSNIYDSLATLERLTGFFEQATFQRKSDEDIRSRVRTLGHDVRSLTDHADFLSQKITFLLDATLGMINIEQSATIKIFSVAAVVFLPPTLIASVYGMNFRLIPELNWMLGYPFALLLMAASAILPYLYFKRRGWL